MFVLKNRHAPELNEANSHARISYSEQMLKNIHPVMLASFFTDENTHLDYTEKHTEWPTARTSVNQEERRRDKTPRLTNNVESLTLMFHKVV